jgi:hypothetical protein
VGGKRGANWFAARYRGGNVLITYVNNQAMMFYLLTGHHFLDRAFITDANGSQFEHTLAQPQQRVRWIVMDSDASNGASPIWTALHRQTAWRQYFVLRATFATTQIYERSVAPGGSTAAPALPDSQSFVGLGEAQLAPAGSL